MDYSKLTPIELLDIANKSKNEHDELKKKIFDKIKLVDDLDKEINNLIEKLKDLEQNYVKIVEELDKR